MCACVVALFLFCFCYCSPCCFFVFATQLICKTSAGNISCHPLSWAQFLPALRSRSRSLFALSQLGEPNNFRPLSLTHTHTNIERQTHARERRRESRREREEAKVASLQISILFYYYFYFAFVSLSLRVRASVLLRFRLQFYFYYYYYFASFPLHSMQAQKRQQSKGANENKTAKCCYNLQPGKIRQGEGVRGRRGKGDGEGGQTQLLSYLFICTALCCLSCAFISLIFAVSIAQRSSYPPAPPLLLLYALLLSTLSFDKSSG